MPPKTKFTKEKILSAALEILKAEGEQGLSVRSLANQLNCSSQPIFSCFANMEKLMAAVEQAAKDEYAAYIQKGLLEAHGFKGAGLQYIRFAMEEPQLFRFLFMREKKVEEQSYMPGGDENAPQVLAALMKSHGLSKERARALYNHISVYSYGLAVTFLAKKRIFTIEDADRMLSEVFWALMKEAKNDQN